MKNLLFNIFMISVVSVTPACAKRRIDLQLYKIMPLNDVKGRLDHMAIDVSGKRLFVSALGNNTLEIIDFQSGKILHRIRGLSAPQGVAYIPEFDKIYVNNGGNGKCNIYDAKSYKLLSTIDFGTDADNIRYDDDTHCVYIGYGSGGIAAVDAESGKVIFNIPLPAHPESFALEKYGPSMYVNVPEFEGSIIIIDRNKKNIIGKWKLGDRASNRNSNFPMCLDEANHRLFVGTFVPPTCKVIDTHTGKEVTEWSIPGDCDDMYYDKSNRIVLFSCGQGYIDFFGQADPDHYKEIKKLHTSKAARTSLYSKELGLYFLAVPERKDNEAAIWVYKIRMR